MRGYVAGADVPFQPALGAIAVQFAGRDVILGVGHVDVAGNRVDLQSVGLADHRFCPVFDKTGADQLSCSDVHDAIADSAGL